MLCKMIRDTGWVHVLAERGEVPETDEAIMVGMCHVIAEMVVTAGPRSTAYRRASEDLGLLRQQESHLAQARFTGP